ncbi:MAG: hypothetical protein ACKVQQ_24190 [Burkholderiales bacterium]
MVRCFLTGVESSLEEAFVLNRRESRDLLAALRERVASLERVIEQFSPLDTDDGGSTAAPGVRAGTARARHRLVCKAVADAMGAGFPEVRLFLPWPEYHARARFAHWHSARHHPLYGAAIAALDTQALRRVEALGRDVLRLLDPAHALPPSLRSGLAMGTSALHKEKSAGEIIKLLQRAAAEGGDPAGLGLTQEALDGIGRLFEVRADTRVEAP